MNKLKQHQVVFFQISYSADFITSITTSLHIVIFCALRLLSISKPHVFSRIKIIHAKVSVNNFEQLFVKFLCRKKSCVFVLKNL